MTDMDNAAATATATGDGGDSLDEFLRQFPSVTRERAQAALALAREALEARLVAA